MKKKPRKLKSLKDEAWKWFSIWVRSNTADFADNVQCYTCPKKVNWRYNCDAGHYRHDSHDYDPRNVKPQCKDCNMGGKGRADNFYLHLIQEYGLEVAEELRKRAKWNDYSRTELMEVIEKYKGVDNKDV